MLFDYNKLRGLIIEKFGSVYNFSKVLNISYTAINRKLHNETSFSQKDIVLWCEKLGISDCDIKPYFFTLQVQSV